MSGNWSGFLSGFGSVLVLCVSPMVANGAAPETFGRDASDPLAVRCDRAMDQAAAARQPGKTALQAINPAQSLADCRVAALRQPPRARYQYLYAAALLAAKRYPEAATQLTAADAAGYGPAATTLGEMYYKGVGVSRNPAKAQELWARAGAEGDPVGFINQAIASLSLTPPGYNTARGFLERASRMDSLEADTRLGAMYLYGIGGAKDETRGIALLQKSSDAGDPEAQLALGSAYLQGTGVARDPSRGAQLLRRSATGGNLQAADILGYTYYNGDGVPKDEIAGLAWYAQAAAANDPVGMTYLADAFVSQGKTTDALPWLQKAANLNYAPAERDLGTLYDGDRGIPGDPAKVFYWHKRAADHGDALGKLMLGEDYAYGVGVSRDTTVARKLYLDAQRDPSAAPYVAQDLARLDARPAQASQPAPAAPSPTAAPSGNYWPDIPDDPFGGDGGFVRPNGNDSAQAPQTAQTAQQPVTNSAPQQSRTQHAAPSPFRGGAAPARPVESPLVRHAQSSSQQPSAGVILGIGFAALVVASVLFRGSGSSSGSMSYQDNSLGSSGIGGFDFGGGSKTYPPMQSPMPMSTPMNGDITRILHGADALGLNGPVNRQ